MNAVTRQAERDALRAELRHRILMQNALLQTAPVVFLVGVLGMAAHPAQAWSLAAALNAVFLAAASQWCHHGVRTAQLKAFLVLHDPDEDGWEFWLPRNRPRTLLGSRWLISTKGVFLGLGLAALLIAIEVGHALQVAPALLSLIALAASAYLLLSNPKE